MKPTERFTDRVADYVRFRPDYPDVVITLLKERLGLGPECVVADLGSGTGIFTAKLLGVARLVYGIEPNAVMRAAAEARFAGEARFVSVVGTAEATTLPDGSCDLVVAAQAFHWFDVQATRSECQRIVRGRRGVGLVWNERDARASTFMAEYERLLDAYADYAAVRRSDEKLAEKVNMFIGAAGYTLDAVPSHQVLDREGLRGRLMSSSYCPKPGHPDHEPLMREIDELFAAHQIDGRVRFEYRTAVYTGRL